jgi:AraC-like DNA-binding protein
MDLLEPLKLVKSLSALLLIILSVFLFSSRSEKHPGSVFLASFLLARSFMLISYVSWDFYLTWKVPDLASLANPFLYLYCPLLFLYIKALTSPSFTFKKIEWLHFLPAVFVFFYYLFYFNIHPFDVKINMIKTGTFFTAPVVSWKVWIWIQLSVYGSLCVYLLMQYEQNLKNFKSSINRTTIKWLSFLIYAFLVWKAIFLTYFLAGLLTGKSHMIFQIFVETFFLFYAIGIVFYSLKYPEIHLKPDERLKYRSSPLTSENKILLKSKLEQYIKTEKPYLNAEFDLSQLSAATQIPTHHLSQLFSEVFKLKFFDYCNKCRIEEVIKLLSDRHNMNKTILEIMYCAGFNSKSVFNASFKRYMGMTPREYKRNVIELKNSKISV